LSSRPARLTRRFRPAAPGAPDAGPAAPSRAPREVFRRGTPVAIWWIWLVFAVANLADLATASRTHFVAVVAAILVTVTGAAYACALRPRVVADDAGITVVNPLRDYRVPWGAVQRVDVRDWVRVHAAPGPGTDATKTIDSWALFAPARVKRNSERKTRSLARGSADAARLPEEAVNLMSLPLVVAIARQLDQRARRERDHGAPSGPVTATWAWPSVAAMAVPAIALLIVALT
jgi:Bacterial PH domain